MLKNGQTYFHNLAVFNIMNKRIKPKRDSQCLATKLRRESVKTKRYSWSIKRGGQMCPFWEYHGFRNYIKSSLQKTDSYSFWDLSFPNFT